jgi:hypothetical protein
MKNQLALVIILMKLPEKIAPIADNAVNKSMCTNKNVNVRVKVFIYVFSLMGDMLISLCTQVVIISYYSSFMGIKSNK